jgi:hypothetical protein
VMLIEKKPFLIRKRETLEDFVHNQILIDIPFRF